MYRVYIFYLSVFIIFWIIFFGITQYNFFTDYKILLPIIVFLLFCKLKFIPNNDFILHKKFVQYCLWLTKEIMSSAIYVSKMAWSPKICISQHYKAINVAQFDDWQKILYMNSITLTPGTISVNCIKRDIIIHSLHMDLSRDLEERVMYNKIYSIKS